MGGQRQVHLHWWQERRLTSTAGLAFSSPRLGRTVTSSPALVAGGGYISAEEHTNVFVYEPGGVICTHVLKHNDVSERGFTTTPSA